MGLILLTLFSLFLLQIHSLGLGMHNWYNIKKFLSERIFPGSKIYLFVNKNNLRVDFSSEFVSLEMYYFGTNYGYASIYFGELIIFFNTISSCYIYCKF